MIEVRVQCICTAIQSSDLGEKLFRGDVLFLSKEKADKSKDLTLAKQNKAVLCQEVTRCQEQKTVAPTISPYGLQTRKPVSKPPAPSMITLAPSSVPVAAPIHRDPPLDQDKLAKMIAEKVAQALNRAAVVIQAVPEQKLPLAEVPANGNGLGEDGVLETETPKKKRIKKEVGE
jgi:hypothetical protein